MASIRRIVTQWGRRIAGGLILALLFSQMALAMYACPKPDSAGHIASMQAAGMAMEDPVDMPSLPDCHAMSGTMDDEAAEHVTSWISISRTIMLISSSGAPGERRPAPSHGAMRAISCGPRVHRLSILTIALMGGVFASSQA